ncbi:MAG: hypothetical protein MRY57_02650 [Candidatus Pacebacteria bacterium]|nr:hypothetical protein [Candidatus Paceibacterota bacterium]
MSQKNQTLASLQFKLEILNLNYWEHFKFAQDLVRSLGPTHPQYINMQNNVNDMLEEINKIQKEIKQHS